MAEVLQKLSVKRFSTTSCNGPRTPREGMRLGEVLCLTHGDWHPGSGGTPFIQVVPRDHSHGARVKGGRGQAQQVTTVEDCQASHATSKAARALLRSFARDVRRR